MLRGDGLMIRKFEPWDIDDVMEIWLYANLEAHDFIDGTYFENACEMVRSLIPSSEVYVYEEDSNVTGFIGLEEGFVQGLFVKPGRQRHGIGQALLEQVKSNRDVLMLKVYRKNEKAISFYRREGFDVAELEVEEATGETEITMKWCRA